MSMNTQNFSIKRKRNIADAERVKAFLADDVQAFLANGGKIKTIPGFTEVAPIRYRAPQKIDVDQVVGKKAPAKVNRLPDTHMTIDQLAAHWCISADSIRYGIRSHRIPEPQRIVTYRDRVVKLWSKEELKQQLKRQWVELLPHMTTAEIAAKIGRSGQYVGCRMASGLIPPPCTTMRVKCHDRTAIINVWSKPVAEKAIAILIEERKGADA
jgi:hypothetical protein